MGPFDLLDSKWIERLQVSLRRHWPPKVFKRHSRSVSGSPPPCSGARRETGRGGASSVPVAFAEGEEERRDFRSSVLILGSPCSGRRGSDRYE